MILFQSWLVILLVDGKLNGTQLSLDELITRFRVTRDKGCFRAANGGTNGGASSSTTRLNNHLNLPSRQSSGILPQISEIGSEKPFASTHKYAPNFGSDSWDNNSISGHKRARDDGGNIFFGINTMENQVEH